MIEHTMKEYLDTIVPVDTVLLWERPELHRPGTMDYSISCPFHDDSVASFRVYRSRNFCKCFGECQRGWEPTELLAAFRQTSIQQAMNLMLSNETLGSQISVLVRAQQVLHAPAPQNTLSEEEDDLRTIAIEAGQPATDYLLSRGISFDAIWTADASYSPRREAVAIPHSSALGLHAITYRSLKPGVKEYWISIGPLGDCPFGIHRFNDGYAVLCESEIDAMSFWTAGVKAISLSISRMPQYLKYLNKFIGLIPVFDGDAPGQRAAKRFQSIYKTGLVRPIILEGGHDANDLMTSYPATWSTIVHAAKSYGASIR